MAERSFKSWQGEDLLPEYDFTEPSSKVHVIWPEIEVGGRAWRGESDVGTVQLRDERGETGQAAGLPADLTSTSISAHNRWAWTENSGADVMARGWIGPKDYRRDREGGLKPDRHREVAMSVLDANAQLQGIIVDANRGAETDVARVQWLLATYLQGSPRATTNLTDTYLVTGSNTVNLPAQHVIGDPRSILEEIASFANKQFFVTSDEELFYDGADSVAYYSTLAISDRLVCDAPSPPTQNLTPLITWDFQQGNTLDTTATYNSGVNYTPPSYLCPNATACGWNDASSHVSDVFPVVAGQAYRFTSEVRWYEDVTIRNIGIRWHTATGFTNELLVTGSGHAEDVTYYESALVTAPADCIGTAQLDFGQFLGVMVDNVVWSGVETLSVTCFPPIWDVGPAASEDGQQLLSGLRLYYGAGQSSYVYVSDPVTRSEYTHYEESLTAPENITTAAAATTLANTILARRKTEDRNINVSIGPLTIDEAVQVKYGQLIPIKARAIAFADDNYFTGRIRQLRWTTPVPGMFFAHMQIERPIKDVPYGVGNRSGSEAVQAHMDSGSNSHPDYVLRGILTTQGDLPYRGASDWTRLGIGASNTVLASLGTGAPQWLTIPNASGGSVSGSYNPDIPPSTGLSLSDEFDDSSLNGAWTWDTAPGGTVSESLYPGFLNISGGTNNTGTDRLLRRAFVPGASTAFSAAMKGRVAIENGSYNVGLGLYCLTSADAIISGVWLGGDGTLTVAKSHRLFGMSGAATQWASTIGTPLAAAGALYFLVTRSTADVYKCYWSLDGMTWQYMGTHTTSTTVAKIAIVHGGDTDALSVEVNIDFVRVFNSVTRKIGA